MELTRARAMTLGFISEHKLEGWGMKFDTAKVRFGYCNYRKKEIGLSRQLVELNTEEEVKNIILHEIAHAIIGPGNGHKRKWKMAAISVGCEPKRCYGDGVITPTRRYTGTCPTCGTTVQKDRHRKGSACIECCGGTWNEEHVFTWTRN